MDRYMLNYSVQKQSVINSLVHKAFAVSDKEHLQTESSETSQSSETSLRKERT